MSPVWLWTTLAAFGFTLAHLFVDFHIGLFGPSSTVMTPLQASLAGTLGVLWTWWALALGRALQGSGPGRVQTFTFVLGWAFLINGVAAFFSAPPPSAGFPYQDLTHLGSLVFGGAAAVAVWRRIGDADEAAEWRAAAGPAAVIVLATALEAALAL